MKADRAQGALSVDFWTLEHWRSWKMPLFRRPDGVLVKGESPERRMMPFLMPRRSDSLIFHDQHLDVTRARAWLREQNRASPPGERATLFALFLHACGQTLHRWSGVNRFVSGRHLYQRRGAFITFAAKETMTTSGSLRMMKLPMLEGESISAFVRRMGDAVDEARQGRERAVDREVQLLLRLPGWLLSSLVAAGRWLDRWNLFPWAMMRDDPMFTSLFASNIGSAGMGDVYHHLYEYGTGSLFAMFGAPHRTPEGRVMVQVRWTFDERVNDGLYCGRALDDVRRQVENPG
jgi:hypothetical protein